MIRIANCASAFCHLSTQRERVGTYAGGGDDQEGFVLCMWCDVSQMFYLWVSSARAVPASQPAVIRKAQKKTWRIKVSTCSVLCFMAWELISREECPNEIFLNLWCLELLKGADGLNFCGWIDKNKAMYRFICICSWKQIIFIYFAQTMNDLQGFSGSQVEFNFFSQKFLLCAGRIWFIFMGIGIERWRFATISNIFQWSGAQKHSTWTLDIPWNNFQKLSKRRIVLRSPLNPEQSKHLTSLSTPFPRRLFSLSLDFIYSVITKSALECN